MFEKINCSDLEMAKELEGVSVTIFIEEVTGLTICYDVLSTFVTTYHAMISDVELLEMLKLRVNSVQDTERHIAIRCVKLIYLSNHSHLKLLETVNRVIGLLKRWMGQLSKKTLAIHKQEVISIAEAIYRVNITRCFPGFIKFVERLSTRKEKWYSALGRTNISEFDWPCSIVPQNEVLSLLDISPKEIARQWTLIEFKMYQKIKMEEFNIIYTKINPEERAPNLVKFTRFSESVSQNPTKPRFGSCKLRKLYFLAYIVGT
jgi:hypothetical protein